jgi:cell division protein FtsI (penicillin-binding protein 3)
MTYKFGNTSSKSPLQEMMFRLRFLLLISALFVLFLLSRLIYIQIVKHNFYSKLAERQYQEKVKIPARRGLILDREGNILATNIIRLSFAVDPVYLIERMGVKPEDMAVQFERIFSGDRRYYLEKLRKRRRFVWIERDVSPDIARRFDLFVDSLISSAGSIGEKIRIRNIYKGVIKVENFVRYYPFGELAGQVLGFVSRSGDILSGLELKFDNILRGRDGYMIMQRDALGELKPSIEYAKIPPVDGYNIKLTIDLKIQSIVEGELRDAVKRFKADGGVVIVMDPKTGEILAMANYPEFDPNRYWKYSSDAMRNRAIMDAFEPGSTFKIVPSALLLDKGMINSDDRIDVDNGVSHIRGVRVVDFKPYHILNFREILKFSSNIGMAKLSLRLPSRLFFRYTRNFGFGCFTGINLPGESKGEVKFPDRWNSATKIFMSFGYELRATPLQIITAYSSIANGGIMMQPRIVKAIVDSDGRIVQEFRPVVIRRVVSERTAKLITEILEDVVNEGTGVRAKVRGVRVAGKTGTAQKYEGGIYSKSHYRASFVGFFPVDDPKYVCLVMLESPRRGYSGGIVAAPIFKRIAEGIIKMSNVGISAENLAHKLSSKVDDKKGEDFRRKPAKVSSYIMPDLRDMSVREAFMKLDGLRVRIKIIGSGRIFAQFPTPGRRLKPGSKVILYCSSSSK